MFLIKIKLSKSILAIVIVGVLMASCKKEDPVDSSQNSNGVFTASIDGVPFTSKIVVSYLAKDTAINLHQLLLSGLNADDTEMSMGFNETIMSEAFAVGAHSMFFFRMSGANEDFYIPIASSVNLTSSDAVSKTVSGTFQFTGKHDVTGDTVNVTNGVFTHVKYQVVYEE